LFIVEDDEDFQKYLKSLLIESDFAVKTFSRGIDVMNALERNVPEIILLDLILPDIDGVSLCSDIKKDYPEIPVIILTAKDSVADKVKGLGIGADDYITKPFAPEELVARMKTRIKSSNFDNSLMKIADLSLDRKKIEVKRSEKMISLTPQEFKLLEYLMSNRNIVLTREMILNRIWLYSPDIESRVVDVYVGYLRKKIDTGFKKKLIHSVRGFGYTIKA